MIRSTIGVGSRPNIWLLSILRLRKCFKLRYLILVFFALILLTYLRLFNRASGKHPLDDLGNLNSKKNNRIASARENPVSSKCQFDQVESLLRYKPLKSSTSEIVDSRANPSIDRLHKLFSILISHEDKFRSALDYLGIFRFTDLDETLQPFANNTQRLQDISCLFQRFITISDNGHIDITPSMIDYLKHVSWYLSDGFKSEHSLWKTTSMNELERPVIVLGANARFFDTLQGSMRTVNQFFSNHTVAIYDLGFDQNQVNLVSWIFSEEFLAFVLSLELKHKENLMRIVRSLLNGMNSRNN